MTVEPQSAPILIAGAGIAGLTAALAFAARGFEVEILERSAQFRAIGAGIQLSPNATRILRRLDVLPMLEPTAAAPRAIVLRSARNLREIANVPLGKDAEKRWGAPYLVVHRSDLQTALLQAVSRTQAIRLSLGCASTRYTPIATGVRLTVEHSSADREVEGALLVGADGVWSRLRESADPSAASIFSGDVAWRRTVPAGTDVAAHLLPDDCVSVFLSPRFHLIAYPVKSGAEINLVAITAGQDLARDWSVAGDATLLAHALGTADPMLARLAEDPGAWRPFPIHTIDPSQRWIFPGLALIGDAAHAMTPYAAQGAAMAIEDADTLAEAVSVGGGADVAASLASWEAQRRARIRRVRQRGAFNRFAWHAAGPIAVARDVVLASRSPARLAADMDWLYGGGR